jgi:hypothetical protein
MIRFIGFQHRNHHGQIDLNQCSGGRLGIKIQATTI